MITNIRTAVNPYIAVYKTDATTASFPTLSPTTGSPAGDGVVQLAPNTQLANGQTADNNIKFLFYGTGGDNSTFSAQIVYWSSVPFLKKNNVASSTVDLWVPEIVCNIDGVLCATVGSSGTYIDASHRFADTLSLTSSTANITANAIISPANNSIASITMDLSGTQMVEVIFDLGSATAMNAIYKTF